MGRVPDLRNIKQEDFDKKDQALVEKLAFPINNFMQQVVSVLKQGIDFNNLNQQIFVITTSVDVQGVPVTQLQFKNALTTKVIGMICINAINKSTTLRTPSAAPFITWSANGNLMTISNINGLGIPEGQVTSDSYELTILTVGANIPTA